MLIVRRVANTIRRVSGPNAAFLSDAPWNDQSTCRNCGAAMNTPFCGACGQKAAQRLAWRTSVQETWERVRLFELPMVKTMARLALAPGRVAREYVLGRRSANMHPLKLLVALVAILVVMLAANQYFARFDFAGRDAVVDKMAKRVMLYANWSFSIGIVAIFLGSWTVLRRRLGYNALEHATLAIYCQCVTLGLVIVNLLPTLVWRDAQFVMWHKAAAQYYMFALKLLIVAVGYKQFFLLDLRSDWPRWAGALAVYAVSSWLLLRAYALSILWLVS